MTKIGSSTLLVIASLVTSGLSGCGNDSTGSNLFPDSGAQDATFDATIPPDAYEAAVDAAPSAVVPTADIDFGLADCGGAPPGQQTFTIQNAGAGDLTWSASLDSATYFFIVGPTKGVIPAGGCDGAPCEAVVTLSANAIPGSATAGLEEDSTVTVTTNDPAHASTSIKVKVTPAGGTLLLQPSTVGFGLVPLNTPSSPIPISLRNAGNKDVTITFQQPTDAEYQLTWNNAPAQVTVPGNSPVLGLEATFTPSTTTPTSTSAAFTVTGALCGTSPSSIPMTGQGSVGSIAVSPSVLDFAKVNCGATASPASQSVTLTNTGASPFSWNAQLKAGASSPFTLASSSGTVPAATDAGAATGTVKVTASAIPAEATVADDAFGDTLEITTNIPGDVQHDVDLRETAQGVILAFSPSSLPFNNVPLATNPPAQISFQVVNSGNAPVQGVTVALEAGDAGAGFFSLGQTTLGNIAAAASSSPDGVTFTPGNSTSPESATVTVAAQAGTVFCAAPLPTLAVSGTGTNGNLVLGATSIPVGQTVDNTQSPPMGFGLCGSTPSSVSFDISNSGNGAFTYTASLPGGTLYALGNASNSVAPGGKQTVTVTVSQIGAVQDEAANGLGATVSVSTDIFNDTGVHQVTLRMTAKGALFNPSTGSIDFTTVPVGDAGSSNFTVTNTGNSNASVGFTVAAGGLDGGASPFGVTAGQEQIDGGNGSATYTATFAPTAPGPQSSQLIWNVTGTMCQTQPTPISVQGTGQ